MKKILFVLLLLSACSISYDLDYSKSVEVCVNEYDKKDFIIFYSENKSSFVSQSVGVTQYTFVDYKQDRRMLNEFEMEYFKCQQVSSEEQLTGIIQ